jgi:uncharacterized membrane protein YsdA (DUF1294 family)
MRENLINYYLFINALAFLMASVDKVKARKKKWRISEKVLHSVSFLGGALGTVLAMILFRHKVQKNTFIIATAAATALHLSLIIYLMVNKYV